jgi:hypothetical protein
MQYVGQRFIANRYDRQIYGINAFVLQELRTSSPHLAGLSALGRVYNPLSDRHSGGLLRAKNSLSDGSNFAKWLRCITKCLRANIHFIHQRKKQAAQLAVRFSLVVDNPSATNLSTRAA